MKSISLKAVFIGGIVDVGASTIAGIIAAILATGILAASHQGGSAADAARALAASSNYRLAMYVLGGSFSILAGYIAARIARHDQVLNGALSSWLCVLLSIGELTWQGSLPSLGMLSGLVLSPLLGAAGGYLGTRGRGGELAARAE
jgi:hypothetical protein